MGYEDTFRSIKIKDRIGLKKDASIVRKYSKMSMAEHDSETRFSHVEKFITKPCIAAQNGYPYNQFWQVSGTNMTSALVDFDSGGGILLTLAGADADSALLGPNSTSNYSALATVILNTGKKVRWATRIKTGASIATQKIWAGLKLTNVDVIATDNDQAFFRYENGVNSGKFQIANSNNGTDQTQDSGVTVEAATEYELVIEIDENRIPRYYINDVHVGTGNALKANTNLVSYHGLKASGAALAATLNIRYIAISRDY